MRQGSQQARFVDEELETARRSCFEYTTVALVGETERNHGVVSQGSRFSRAPPAHKSKRSPSFVGQVERNIHVIHRYSWALFLDIVFQCKL